VRLLSLFSDLGMRVRTGGPGLVGAMGALLPAIAAASEGLAAATAAAERARQLEGDGAREKDGLMTPVASQGALGGGAAGVASSRFSYDGFAKAQKEDGARMKVRVCACVVAMCFSSATTGQGAEGGQHAHEDVHVL